MSAPINNDNKRVNEPKVSKEVTEFDQARESGLTQYNENNPHIYTDQNDQIWCVTCQEKMKTPAASGIHCKKKHGITLDGKKVGEKPPENGNNSNDNGPDWYRKRLEELGEQSKQEITDLGAEGFDVSRRKKAEAIARVLENPYVSVLLQEARLRKVIPPLFDEGDIIREALDYYLTNLGIGAHYSFDPRLIQDPELHEKIKKAADMWRQYESGEGNG